jgi:hypothetical protein
MTMSVPSGQVRTTRFLDEVEPYLDPISVLGLGHERLAARRRAGLPATTRLRPELRN